MKVTHDLHIHTSLSLCAARTAFLKDYIANAEKAGLTKIGISNHFWDGNLPYLNNWYAKQNYDHVSEIIPEIEEANKKGGIRVLYGCEAEYDPKRHAVGLTPEVAEKFEYVLVPNSHTHMTMPKELYEPYEKHMQFMIDAYYDIINSDVSKYITAIAHPFEAVCCPYNNGILIDMIDDDTFKRMFDLTAEKGIAIEINTSGMLKKTPEEIAAAPVMRMFRLAKECGCKFVFGSDYHNTDSVKAYAVADLCAELLGIEEKDICDMAKNRSQAGR